MDVTDDSVELLAEHTSFKNMKVNPMTNMSHALKVSAFLYSKQQRIQIGIGWPQSQEIDQSYQKTNEYSNNPTGCLIGLLKANIHSGFF